MSGPRDEAMRVAREILDGACCGRSHDQLQLLARALIEAEQTGPCDESQFSSRCCERGTRGCVVHHDERATLTAERDSLRAELAAAQAERDELRRLTRTLEGVGPVVARLEAERDEARRHQSETLGNFDALSFEYERDTARPTAERDAARREVEGMRAVVEAGREWREYMVGPAPGVRSANNPNGRLIRALDALDTPGDKERGDGR